MEHSSDKWLDLWYKAMVDFVCVTTRILIVKFKFEKGKACLVLTYGTFEGDVEEMIPRIIWMILCTKWVAASDWLF